MLPPAVVVILLLAWIQNPVHVIEAITRFLPFKLTVKSAQWTSFSSIHVSGEIKLGDFARIRSMDMDWNWFDLMIHGEIDSVEMDGPQLWTERLKEAFPDKKEPGKKSDLIQLSIHKIKIQHGYLFLENLIPKVTLNIPLGRVTPLYIENFQIGNPDSDAAQQIQHTISSKIILYAPLNVTSPVLSFEEIQLDFTFQELAHHTIRKLMLKQPTIFVGPDLFWFIDQFKANQQKGETTPWTIQNLDIEMAGITVNGFGDPGVEIPIHMDKKLTNVRTDQLGEVFRKNQFPVDSGDRFYPAYGLKIYQFGGRVEFGLPVTEENAANQVITLKASSMEWKKLVITEPWVSVTFDSRGIFGKIGGKAYKGYLVGQCSIFFKEGFPWSASLHGNGLNLEDPVSKFAEDHFRITGTMNMDVQVTAKSTVFEKSTAKIALIGGGKMVIPSIDDVIKKLPASWSPLKKQLTTTGLFDYTSGTWDLMYDPVKSQSVLELIGKQGRRRFQVDWTQE
ncbi:MAG: hypothetical protein V4507_02125 [Verrucomicrobiota bacterium]